MIALYIALGILGAAAIIWFVMFLGEMYGTIEQSRKQGDRLDTKYWELRNRIEDLEKK